MDRAPVVQQARLKAAAVPVVRLRAAVQAVLLRAAVPVVHLRAAVPVVHLRAAVPVVLLRVAVLPEWSTSLRKPAVIPSD